MNDTMHRFSLRLCSEFARARREQRVAALEEYADELKTRPGFAEELHRLKTGVDHPGPLPILALTVCAALLAGAIAALIF